MYLQVFLTIYIKVITEREYLLRNLFNEALKAHRVSHSSQNIFCGLQFTVIGHTIIMLSHG
jgi:hypothetical protein